MSVPRCVAMAVLALAAACGLYLTEIADAGFPDGHLTDHQRWILPYQRIAAVVLVALAVGFAALAVARPRASARLFTAAVVAAIVVALAAFAVLPAIGLHAMKLEHGQGG